MSRDEDTCCTSQAQCGNTPDPITHSTPRPTLPGGSPVPTKTAKPAAPAAKPAVGANDAKK